jgi:hypothetical protein
MILSPAEAAEFSSLMAAIDAYANQRLGIEPGLLDAASMSEAPPDVRLKVRDARHGRPDILDGFVKENPFGLPDRALADAAALRHAVVGRFVIERVLKTHAVLIAYSGTKVYAVGGLTRRIDEVIGAVGPVGYVALVRAALLPWRGRIVWDGLVEVSPIFAGPGIRRRFKENYLKAKESGAIVRTLGEPAPLPARAPRDWRPAVADIALAADRLGKPQTRLQAAAFALLQASARLAQAALDDDPEAVHEAARKAQSALRKVVVGLEP